MKVHLACALRSVAVLAAIACLGSSMATAETEPVPAIDWSQHADADTVVVVTTDEDGASRETTIWLAVVDGNAFIRTGSTSWGDNVEREPSIVLRIEKIEIPVDAKFIEDDVLREEVVAAFREKYGFTDSVMGLFRGNRPRIMQLDGRP